ncbi:MAG: nucleoside deaminase [Alphaproteobacteria bacterium]|nr:nucleoside deaminase [Alphaproteobacteria bacterium]
MEKIIQLALEQAKEAFQKDEVPVGAVIFNSKTKDVLCVSHNLVVSTNDPSAHAEILALRQAGELLCNYNLSGYSLFVTLEPCVMCAGALSWAKVDAVYFGAYDVKSGAIENGPCLYQCTSCHHKPEVFGGFHEKECQKLMTDFFERLR